MTLTDKRPNQHPYAERPRTEQRDRLVTLISRVPRPQRVMPREKYESLSERQREILIEVGELFADGFTHLTMADIAAKLNCSLRTLYTVAKSREDLVLIVLDRNLWAIGQAARSAIVPGMEPLDAIAAFLKAANESASSKAHAFASEDASTPAAETLHSAHATYHACATQALLNEAVRNGSIAPCDTGAVGKVIAGLGRQFTSAEMASVLQTPPTKAADDMAEVILLGLQAQNASTTIDWFGCATFRLQTTDLTIFLDAYIDRPSSAAGPKPRQFADDINTADWILIGHSHFDHLYGAERIMANTKATLVGSYETIRVMEAAGVPADRMICIGGGETIDLSLQDGRGSGVRVTAYPSQHSCVWSQISDAAEGPGSGEMLPADAICLGDLGQTWQEQQARMAKLMDYLGTELDEAASEHLADAMVGHSSRGDGGALVFLIETPDGSIFYQDTSGHWSGVLDLISADTAILAAAGRANVDGEPIQGSLADFVGKQAAMLGASEVILGHHDNWLPGFSIPTDVEPIRAAIAEQAPKAKLLDLGYLDGTSILNRDRAKRKNTHS